MARSRKRASHQSEEVLNKRLKELEFLTRSSHALNSTLDYEALLKLIMKIVKDALDVETVSILFYDEKRENLRFALARGKRGREFVGLLIPRGRGVSGWVAEHNQPLIVNDLKNSTKYSLHLQKDLGAHTHSIMSIPLKRRSKVIGVIEAVNRKKNKPFTDDDLSIFVALGDHIATAIENARLYREADRRSLESTMLYEASVSLGKALKLDETLDNILSSLKKLMPYDAGAIFVLDRKNQLLVSHIQRGYRASREDKLRLKLDEGLVGWAAQHKESLVVPDTSKDPRYVNARRRTRSEMVTPMLSRGTVIGLFVLESNRLNAYRKEDLHLLEAFAAQAGVSIERATLFEEQRVKQEIERELKIARTIQEFFTPRTSLRLGGYTMAGRNYPSLELSGDYLDVFPLSEPLVAFAIADVAGKGVPASIIMASFRATLHTAAPYLSDAKEFAQRANEILLETVRPNDFVTAFIGVLNTDTGEVSYCSAGHNPAILMKPNGSFKELDTGGPVLGVLKDIELQEGAFELGDQTLFIYSDGTTDAANEKDEPFGFKRLVRFLKKNRQLTPNQICNELRKTLKKFMGGTPPIDDVTYLALKR
jgi:sigma-B regulation protein RsbU (phosphoserine phosphatase)